MREEYLDLLTPQGKPTGETKAKSAVHRDGDWHLSAHIWVLAPGGDILLQRRALGKENDPGLWDISVAGHVDAGETAREGALREMAEEIGLAVPGEALQPLFRLREERRLHGGTYIDREWHAIFALRQEVDLSILRLQAEEVGEVTWIDPARLATWVADRDARLVPHWTEYEALLAYLLASLA